VVTSQRGVKRQVGYNQSRIQQGRMENCFTKFSTFAFAQFYLFFFTKRSGSDVTSVVLPLELAVFLGWYLIKVGRNKLGLDATRIKMWLTNEMRGNLGNLCGITKSRSNVNLSKRKKKTIVFQTLRTSDTVTKARFNI